MTDPSPNQSPGVSGGETDRPAAQPPTKPPPPKGRTRALVLALLMHGVLVALLFVGIRWKSQEPACRAVNNSVYVLPARLPFRQKSF